MSSVRKVKTHVRSSFERGVNFTPTLGTVKFIRRSQTFGRGVNAGGGCAPFGSRPREYGPRSRVIRTSHLLFELHTKSVRKVVDHGVSSKNISPHRYV